MSAKLLVDEMCGGVVSSLRMCGHDAAYAVDRGVESDEELLGIARAEDRTIVTRDVALAERAPSAVLLRSTAVEGQLRALAETGIELSLADPPTRCGRCNGPLEAVPDEDATPAYAPDPAERGVWRCRRCDQHFWRGSHWNRVCETLASIRSAT